ncbi:uncharacterized protein BcabD6B2_31460 [Babesia caballi]|uniref:RNA-editing substrate-binding complex 6 protein domain-containing protein n=1 Tax=Babesia caballi TaxID=5871 RepID=A0AAV4LV38_BABCB|nr:hypothetical protein, conserved [Babesia caballi]
MEEVLCRGPHDAKTWSQLLKRLEIILGSFGHKHIARVAVSLAKSKQCPDDLLRKVRAQALEKLPECDLLSCCGILYGMHRLRVCDGDFIRRFSSRVTASLETAKQPYPVVMLINTFAHYSDKNTTVTLLKYMADRASELNAKAVAIVLVAAATNFGHCSEVEQLVAPLAGRAAELLREMDLRSLCQLYASIAKSGFAVRHHLLDTLADGLVAMAEGLSVHQASLVLAGAARARHVHPQLVAAVTQAIERQSIVSEPRGMLFLLAALLRLNLRDSSLATQLAQALGNCVLRPPELANLIYLAGKWRLSYPTAAWLFSQFSRILESQPHCFSLRDASLIAYGFSEMGDAAQLELAVRVAKETLQRTAGNHDRRALAMIDRAEDRLGGYCFKPSTNSRSPE